MVPSLCTLAENTLIRDILFSSNVSPLLYHCNPSTDHLNFETQFIYNDNVFNVDESIFIPCSISEKVSQFSIVIDDLLYLCSIIESY